MLYNFLLPLVTEYPILNLFRYITFRGWAAILTAFAVSFFFGPHIISWLRTKQSHGQPIREDGPAGHLVTKKGTPTMGGLMIFIAIAVSTLLWSDLSDRYIWVVFFVTSGFGLLGFADDYLKVSKKNTKGVPGKKKLLVQVIISLIAVLWIQHIAPASYSSHLAIPFFKNVMLNLGWFYIPFAIIVIVGASNAVNLTDGLDGLAIVPIMIAAACFALISYLVGHAAFASYLQITPVPGSGEISVFCGALIGAGLGFLWYNAPPARVFMGDTGSLAFGGALGVISIITKHEIVLAIVGGLFVIEAVSVIIQVYYYKFTGGKRFFGMAPIHHHFEKKGWAESTIVIRFWIIAVLFALLGLATLKLR